LSYNVSRTIWCIGQTFTLTLNKLSPILDNKISVKVISCKGEIEK